MDGGRRAPRPRGLVARFALAAAVGGALLFTTGTARPVAVSAAGLSAPGFGPAPRFLTSSPGGCSAAVHGRIHPATGRDQLHIVVRLVGPRRTLTVHALVDTGASQTAFPTKVLRRAGFSPSPKSGRIPLIGVVAGATANAYRYLLPAASILVRAGARWVPLIRRPLGVLGVGRMDTPTLLGPDILAGGASLSATGTRWTLRPPCG